jgi:hypothetical protein
MTESQHRTTDDQPVEDRGPAGAQATEQAVDAMVAAADAVQATLREGQDTAAGVAQQWAGRLAGIPFAALSGGDIAQVVSGRMWLDCTTEMVDALLTVQRRSTERLLHAQYRTAGLIAESGLALATAGWRTVGATPRGPRPDRGTASADATTAGPRLG